MADVEYWLAHFVFQPEIETQVATVATQIQESTKKRKGLFCDSHLWTFFYVMVFWQYKLFDLLSSVAKPTKKVKFVPVNIDLTSMQNNNDDAYDFNTDFV